MKLPKTIPVMGRDYNIVIDKEMDEEGLCDMETITINPTGQTDIQVMAILIHELGHALFRRTGATQGLSSEMEESIVEQYAIFLTETFALKLLGTKRKKG